MSKHDFKVLLAEYPTIIAKMKPTFTSHQFILQLAKANQNEYVKALVAYKGKAPFQAVHKQLSDKLRKFPSLVKYDGEAKSSESKDIWLDPQTCAKWKKI